MPANYSLNLTTNNTTDEHADTDGVVARAATLVLMQCLIIPGNSLIVAAIVTFTKRSVADVLIGCLALIDLLNGLGPVNISISMYYMNLNGSHSMKDLEWLCLLYTWISTCLRLMACFVATLMAIDRFAAIVVPFFYRTRVTPRTTCLCLLVVFIFSVITATLPVAINTIRTYIPLCSFDFTSPFAVFIAVLGYLQLLIVVLCYLFVIFGVNAFLSRQSLIRATQIRASIAVSKSRNRENTLAETSQLADTVKSSPLASTKASRHLSTSLNNHRLRSSSLSPVSIASNKNSSIKKRSQSLVSVKKKRESLFRILVSGNVTGSRCVENNPAIVNIMRNEDAIATTAASSKRGSDFEVIREQPFEAEDEDMVQLTLKEFKRNSITWKHSRRLAIVMGIVVVLFYISWMPIVVKELNKRSFCMISYLERSCKI